MATTTTPPERRTLLRRPRPQEDAAVPAAPRLPSPARQRRWSLALVGVLVTLGSALAFAVLWSNAGDRVPVLVVRQDVAAGSTFESGDVTVVRVAADPELEPIASNRRDAVIGSTAAVDLVAGTLLNEGHLGEDSSLVEGEAVVGLALAAGQLPSPDLQPGDRVLVIQTRLPDARGETAPSDTDDEAAGQPFLPGLEIARATVRDVGADDPSTGDVPVSLVVSLDDAPQVAGAEAADAVSLVVVPAG